MEQVVARGTTTNHVCQGPGALPLPASPAACSRFNSTSERSRWGRRRRDVASRALFAPPPFRPEKLTVNYQESTFGAKEQEKPSRRYTLTHNDLTGALQLSVGDDYNHEQISGFYTRLLRDEVMAEWRFDPRPSLHIYVHVSGEERWLAPPPLRNYIFRRELPLVLESFLWADQHLIKEHPELAQAEVFVHFQSCQQELDKVELWGLLGERASWQKIPTSIMQRMLLGLINPQAARQQAEEERAGLLPQPTQPEAGLTLNGMLPVVATMDVGPHSKQQAGPDGNSNCHPHQVPQEATAAARSPLSANGRHPHTAKVHPHTSGFATAKGNSKAGLEASNGSANPLGFVQGGTAGNIMPLQPVSVVAVQQQSRNGPAAAVTVRGPVRVRGRR